MLSLRRKVLAITVISVLVSWPISSLLNQLVQHLFPHVRLDIYVNTLISLIVTTVLVTYTVQWLIIRPLNRVIQAMHSVAEGNLAIDVDHHTNDEVGSLSRALNHMVGNLRQLITEVAQASEQLGAASQELSASAEESGKASEQIATTVQEVAIGAGRQTESLEHSSKLFEAMSEEVNRIVERFERVHESVEVSSQTAEAGSQDVVRVIEQMQSIEHAVRELESVIRGLHDRSADIGMMLETITQISKQTHLLSLNAAIEAARAGEAGRGFAVVAGEVRKLAEQSAASATEVTGIVTTIQQETQLALESMSLSTSAVEAGTAVVHQVDQSFGRIRAAIETVADQMDEVSEFVTNIAHDAALSNERVREVSEVARQTAMGMENVAASTEEQLASMEEISASSAALTHMAERLQEVIGQFRTN